MQMRRKDREVTDLAVIREILDKARYLHLGLFDGEHPYIVPLHYGYEMDEEGKLTFYMHGARQGHKVDLVKADGRAFIEIDTDEELMYSDIACDNGATYSSVMARGNVTLLEDPAEKVKGLKALMKLQTGRDFEISEKMTNAVSVFKVNVTEYSAKMRTE